MRANMSIQFSVEGLGKYVYILFMDVWHYHARFYNASLKNAYHYHAFTFARMWNTFTTQSTTTHTFTTLTVTEKSSHSLTLLPTGKKWYNKSSYIIVN